MDMDLTKYCLNCFQQLDEDGTCPHCGFRPEDDRREVFHLPPMTILNERYLIGRVINYGGFGIIYKAWDTVLNIAVAIKEYFPNAYAARIPGEQEVSCFTGEKEKIYKEGLKRFRNEAKTLAKFRKRPDIVNVQDIFERNNTAYIAMEYMEGVTLKEYLEQNGKMSYQEMFRILRPVIEAVGAMHKSRIIHRDIAPDNIMLLPKEDGSLSVRLFDFGTARLSRREKKTELTKEIVVKMGYTPPEQYSEKGYQGTWTDVYATGAVAYQMVTGIVPDEATDRQAKDQLKCPREVGADDLPRNADRAIMKALALRRRTRFKSMEDFEHALADKKNVDYPWVEERKRRRRRTVAAVILSAMFVGILAGVGMLVKEEILHPALIAEDKIVVWLPTETEEDLLTMQSIVNEFQMSRKGNMKYDVELVSVPAEDYTEELRNAAGTEDFPDVFRSETLDAEFLAAYAQEESILYTNLTAEDYIHMTAKKQEATAIDWEYAYRQAVDRQVFALRDPAGYVYDVPTSVAFPVAFVNESAARDAEIELPEKFDAAALESFAKKKQLYASPEALAAANALLGAEVSAITDQDAFSALKADRALVYIGFSNDLVAIQDTLPGYYRVIPFAAEKSGAIYSDCWAVSAAAAENRQKLGMHFIIYLLSDYAQQVQCRSTLPINLTALRQYTLETNKKDFGYLAEYYGLN